MSYCKECLEELSADCILISGECVFCHYDTNVWDTNGSLITKQQSIKEGKNIFIHWHKYYTNYYKDLQIKLKLLPRGTFKKRNIKGKTYYYLQYREKEKIIHKYYGKELPVELNKQILLRQCIINKIRQLEPLLFALRISKRKGNRYNRFDILKRDNFTCQYCGKKPPEVELEVDHIIPLSKGGSNEEKNLTTSCERCNYEKKANL